MGAALPAAKSRGSFWQGDSKRGFLASADTATCKGYICLDSCCYYTGEQMIIFVAHRIQNKKHTAKQIAVCRRNSDKSLLQTLNSKKDYFFKLFF